MEVGLEEKIDFGYYCEGEVWFNLGRFIVGYKMGGCRGGEEGG